MHVATNCVYSYPSGLQLLKTGIYVDRAPQIFYLMSETG